MIDATIILKSDNGVVTFHAFTDVNDIAALLKDFEEQIARNKELYQGER